MQLINTNFLLINFAFVKKKTPKRCWGGGVGGRGRHRPPRPPPLGSATGDIGIILELMKASEEMEC